MRLGRINPDAFTNTQFVVLNDRQYQIRLYFEAKHKTLIGENGEPKTFTNYAFLNVLWSNVVKFTYTDTIGDVGLSGYITVKNEAGIFNTILKHPNDYYLCFCCTSVEDAYEENIIFSIINVLEDEKNKTSSNNTYKIYLQEAFAKEASMKSYSVMNTFYQQTEEAAKKAETDANKKKNKDEIQISLKGIADVFGIISEAWMQYSGGQVQPKKGSKGLDGLTAKIAAFIQMAIKYKSEGKLDENISNGQLYLAAGNNIYVENNKELARLLTLDSAAQVYFNDNYPSVEMATALIAAIEPKDTCFDVLRTINNNFYVYKVVEKDTQNNRALIADTLISEKCYLRSENMSLSGYIYPEIYPNIVASSIFGNNFYGERMLTFKNIRTVLYNCFKNNRLLEVFISPEREVLTGSKSDTVDKSKTLKNDAILRKLLPAKITLGNFDDIKYFPPSANQIYDMWGDTVIIKFMDKDKIIPVVHYPFKDIIGIFNNDYLNNSFAVNITPDITNTDGLIFKKSPFGKDELKSGVIAETLASFVYLNNMLNITLPGKIFRKACEMIYIDDYLNTLGSTDIDKPGETRAYNNLLKGGYHFICEVTHTFWGNKYSNSMFVSAFGRPLYNADPITKDIEVSTNFLNQAKQDQPAVQEPIQEPVQQPVPEQITLLSTEENQDISKWQAEMAAESNNSSYLDQVPTETPGGETTTEASNTVPVTLGGGATTGNTELPFGSEYETSNEEAISASTFGLTL